MDKQELQALADRLPYGSQRKIAEAVGCTTAFVRYVMAGRSTMTDTAIAIVRQAKTIDEQTQAKLAGKAAA